MAKDIAEKLNAGIVPIVSLLNQKHIRTDAEVIGLVFPIYESKSPEIINEFIGKIVDIDSKYIFAVCNYGGGIGKELNIMENLLTKKEAKVLGRFSCKGKTFFFFNRGHPGENDLDEAISFAQKMVKKG